jgi:hypothetical protein
MMPRRLTRFPLKKVKSTTSLYVIYSFNVSVFEGQQKA